jgi:type VI secretion system secreted protein Hcp
MAFDAFLKIETIDGESSHGSLSAERANFEKFTIKKALDKATAKILSACAGGQHLPSATVDVCRAGGDKELFMQYKMTDVMIASTKTGGSGGGENIPTEEIALAYGKMEWKYIQTKVAGGKGAGAVAGGWDLKTNKKV